MSSTGLGLAGDGPSVLVVGGAGAIGAATCELFAGQGAKVAVADLDQPGAEKVARNLQEHGAAEAISMSCDVTDPGDCRSAVATTVAAFEKLDVLVDVVGWTELHPFADEHVEYWRRIVDLNLMGCLYLAHAALQPMIDQGSGGAIVLTSSDAGRVGTNGETAYAAAKAGVIGFVKSLAREVARHGVRVNAVSPGPTDSPLLWDHAGDDDFLARVSRSIPMRRIAQPREPAEAIAFLASDRASYVTGQTLSVSGGLTMNS